MINWLDKAEHSRRVHVYCAILRTCSSIESSHVFLLEHVSGLLHNQTKKHVHWLQNQSKMAALLILKGNNNEKNAHNRTYDGIHRLRRNASG